MSIRILARGFALLALLPALLALGLPAAAGAQLTTGSISGEVTAAEDGSPVPGAAATVLHTPTGTTQTVVTNENGRFVVPNLRVGGPYEVTVALDGFQTGKRTGVEVRLGEVSNLEFELALAAVSEEISVVDTGEQLINPNRTGSGNTVTSSDIQNFPNVRRSPLDYVRTNPHFSIRAGDDNEKDISVLGRTSKYNNIQIDGSQYNDVFGLGESGGTPSGQANTQPIIIDALQELQINVSPYDVRQGGFTGGAINAVTKSGTNEFHGTAYYAQRDPDYVGDGPSGVPVANFDEEQIGLSLGGRILPDKLFFFLAGESNTRSTPTGFSADGSSGQAYTGFTDAAAVKSILEGQYGYDPGGLGDFPIDTESDHLFVRLDWNAADNHQVTLRRNDIDAFRDDVSNRSRVEYRFEKATFSRDSITESTVAQLNSVFGGSMFNEARIGLLKLDDVRNVGTPFPSVVVGGTSSARTDVFAGTEAFSGLNILRQDVLEFTDDLTFLHGDHTITVGTHNEFFEIENFFLSNFYGFYWFPTVADLAAGVAAEYQVSFATGSDPARATAIFDVKQYGVYAGDVWRQAEDLTISYGLRLDMVELPDSPTFNPVIQADLGVNNSDVPSGDVTISPRFGFNWDPQGDGKSQLRGGLGVFAGRTPYVWISNVYQGTGIETISTTVRGAIPFVADPLNQPKSGSVSSRPTVDLIDPDFEFPQVLRATLAYDRELPWWSLRGSAELIWSQTQEDIFFQNANKVRNGNSVFDGRPFYATRSTRIFDAPLMTNTSDGEEMALALVLSRPPVDGFSFRTGYTYTEAESAFEGNSSRHISTWRFWPTSGDIDSPELADSSYVNEHRFFLNASYRVQTGPVGHNFGLQYVAESGRPYSLLMGFDANGDGQSTNDLLFVPANPDDVILSGFTLDQFQRYLRIAGYGGETGVLERNGAHMPWTRRLDFHYGLEVPISRVSAEVTLDILNVMNLIDENDGVVDTVAFNTTTPIRASVDPATGKLVYSQNFTNSVTDPSTRFSRSDVLSRWQARLGLKLRF